MADTQAKPPRWWPGFRRDIPLARGMGGYWPCWEGQAEKAYDVANPFDTGNHGTLTNGPTWTAAPSGQSIDFVGSSSQSVQCGLIDMSSLPGMSFVVFGKYDASGSDEHTIMSNWKDAEASVLVRIEPGNDTVENFLGTAGGTKSATSAAFDNTQWHLFGLTFNTTQMQAYIDGVPSGSPTATGSAMNAGPSTNALWLGGDSFGGGRDFLTGGISWSALWLRDIGSSGMAQLHADPYALIRPPSTITTFAGLGGGVPQKYMHYARMRAG